MSPAGPLFPTVLPSDLIRLIAQVAVGSGRTKAERRAAKAVSLVSRDLRDVGQVALWCQLALPSSAERVLKASEVERKRLLGLVRSLRWEGVVSEAGTEDMECAGEQVFRALLVASTAITAVKLVNPRPEHLHSLTTAISLSPSRPYITSFHFAGALWYPGSTRDFDESHLLHLLPTMPALASLQIHLSNVDAAMSPPALGCLRLRRLAVDTEEHGLPDDVLGPGVPRHALSQIVDPAFLEDFAFSRDTRHDGWLRWISSSEFTSLRSLDVTHGRDSLAPFLPLLTACLSYHPSLLHLALRDSSRMGISSTFHNVEPFQYFLFSLPSSLQTLTFDFCCPIDEILDDFLVYGPCQALRTYECHLDREQKYCLRWNANTEVFDEYTYPLVPYDL